MNCLELNSVEFSYVENGVFKLKIPTLSFAKGESYFVHGESGSGKSTLLSLLTGIQKPTQGKILLLEKEFSSLKSSERDQIRGEKMGYIFQLFNLIPYLSVFENIALPCRINKERSKKLNLPLEDEIKKLAEKLSIQNLLFKKPSELSVGQSQRVAAARALIGKPALIIADEPTSALDTKNTDLFLKLLFEEAEQNKATLIFVSHDKTLSKHFKHQVSLGSFHV